MPITLSTDANPTDKSALLQALSEENAQLKRQLAWVKNQLFGAKSEKRVIDNPDQPLLTGLMGEPVEPLPALEKQAIFSACIASVMTRIDPAKQCPRVKDGSVLRVIL